jgi:phosphoketolase
MGQGHCVSAIDSVNLLVNNMTRAHAERYGLSDEGLTRLVRDFYSYRLTDEGVQDSPLGSHVNAHTAGGMIEGGYLGFLDLQWVHMPLPGERLVAFLSDGAFEEQRGSDWAPRWWRAEDSGLVMPVMIANGRRIDQRTTMSMQGGVDWFVRHLELNGFDPLVFDGRDPAAFVCAIVEMERRLEAAADAVRTGTARYPVRLPYGIAVAPKGAGFFNEGTNLAHNLPLKANPYEDTEAVRHFNESAKKLWVRPDALQKASELFQRHAASGRPKERDHALAHRHVRAAAASSPEFQPVGEERSDPARWVTCSPMAAIDARFLETVQANPHLRPRAGNPDEMKSNRMARTLDALQFRVTDPEAGIPEAIGGCVITALNEEAVAAAALANKGGINIIVTYEAFAPKMQGIFRQEVTFARNQKEAGEPPGWLSVPLVLTSHAWENAKNEYSHQDPSMAEAMLAESSDVSRVLFPGDYNTAALTLDECYRTQGQLWTLVVPKGAVPNVFTPDEAAQLVRDGGMHLEWAGARPAEARIVLAAMGAYQLREVLKASRRLRERKIWHRTAYILEPGRFRAPRSRREQEHLASEAVVDSILPAFVAPRIFVTHTRPEALLGALQRLHTGPSTAGLGYRNQGGTLSVDGMLFVNRCTWAHVAAEAARLLEIPERDVLNEDEGNALRGEGNPASVLKGP